MGIWIDENKIPTDPSDIIIYFLPVANAIAVDYYKKCPYLDKEELQSEAKLALVLNLKKYDSKRGKLGSYLISKIKFHLVDYNRDHRWKVIKIPRRVTGITILGGLEGENLSRMNTMRDSTNSESSDFLYMDTIEDPF